MSALDQLFGSELLDNSKVSKPTLEVIGDAEYIGIYFSAHWCGPCRSFTPQLATFYKKMKQANKKFEIVFVSADSDLKSFEEYASSMPWVFLPYEKQDIAKPLNKKFKVQGIPTLVILDKQGKVITTDARGNVMNDPQGAEFPWVPPTLNDILPATTKLVKADKTSITWGDLKGKTVGLYFSAHWCGPCRGFTPKFAETYKKVQEKHKDKFEVVFLSSDRDETSFSSYLSEMPWYALPFEESSKKSKLSQLFDVAGIPCLIFVDPETGEVQNANGRSAISSDPEGNEFPWLPKPVTDLATGADGINESPSLIVYGSSLDKQSQEKLVADLTVVAAKSKADKKDFLFFVAFEEDGVAARIRQLTKVEASSKVQLVLLDIPDDGGFYEFNEKDADASQISVISKFIQDYEEKKLQRKQLSP
eukprot:c13721_g1_i1.p1 GENE.c13721_g1_i1~~c13721_g1_i1.p1  ORF type:complete len:427 (+),score=194.87 c13721_g1_i1:27-1283(+)